MNLRKCAVAVLITAMAGCSSPDAESRAQSDTTAATPTRPDAVHRPADSLWFRQARALDLTTDGNLDSVVVAARGDRSDSLQLSISFVVGGKVLFNQDWDSRYQLAMADSSSQRPPASDDYMRRALTRILADVRLTPLDTSYIRDFPNDTAALALARRGPVQSIIVAYGYETTIAVVWDPHAKRFLVAHACC